MRHFSRKQSIVLSPRRSPLSHNQIHFRKPGIFRLHGALERKKVCTYVERKQSMQVLPRKYFFKVKNEGPKVRIVVLGCRQLYVIDVFQTFSPVFEMTTVRTILALVAYTDVECEQIDVVTAFIYGDLEEEIFMEVPDDFKNPNHAQMVCKLQNFLYGLNQAPRQRYAEIYNFWVDELEVTSSASDPCFYVCHKSSSILIISLYVDELLIAGSSKSEIAADQGEFRKRFEMKVLGPEQVMLGLEIKSDRSNRNLFLRQPTYAETVLKRFGMES